MTIIRYIIVYVPLVVMFTVLIILALGPAYIEARYFFKARRQKKDDEFEQKHGYKPRKKQYTGGHF
jgi:hypothetical protein